MDCFCESSEVGIDHWVWTKCGQDARTPARGADGLNAMEGVGGSVGGREDFNFEAIEESARKKIRVGQSLRNGVVIKVGSFSGETLVEIKELLKGIVEPDPSRGAAEQVIVTGKNSPDLTRIASDGLADFEIIQ